MQHKNHRKNWSTDTCYKVDETWKHYAKWSKPDTKVYILNDCIYINKKSRIDKTIKAESRLRVDRGQEEGGMESDCLIGTIFFESDESELDLDSRADVLNATKVYTVNWLILC